MGLDIRGQGQTPKDFSDKASSTSFPSVRRLRVCQCQHYIICWLSGWRDLGVMKRGVLVAKIRFLWQRSSWHGSCTAPTIEDFFYLILFFPPPLPTHGYSLLYSLSLFPSHSGLSRDD